MQPKMLLSNPFSFLEALALLFLIAFPQGGQSICLGTPSPCQVLANSTCIGQDGCTWSYLNNQCNGHALSCQLFGSLHECDNHVGCSWNYGPRFPGSAKVKVLGKSWVQMTELELGDMVFTGSSYQPFYAFSHYKPRKKAAFLQIYTDSCSLLGPLELSGEHLVYVSGKKHPVRADSIQVGDILIQHQQAGQPVVEGGEANVMKIGKVTKTGMYAPLTKNGYLVVNGWKVSTYMALQDSPEFVMLQAGAFSTHVSHQSFLNLVMSPIRLLCTSPAVGHATKSRHCHSFNKEGLPQYVTTAIRHAHWLDAQHWNVVLQVLVFLVVLTAASVSWVLETILLPPVIPWLLLFMVFFCDYYYFAVSVKETTRKEKELD